MAKIALDETIPEGSAVCYLRRASAYFFEPGKPVKSTQYRRAKIITQAGVGEFSTMAFSFDPLSEKIHVNRLVVTDESGKVTAENALAVGLTLSVMSVVMLWLAAGAVAAGLLAFTIFFYAVIYTIWLKRVTPQNIVIGGAAGAFPPLIGWVSATGSVSVEAVLMFALIFMWTPPHFWALALFMRSDYDDADVPMLTVTHGRPATRRHILAYAVLQAALAIGLAFTSIGGVIYLIVALICNAIVLKDAVLIWRRDELASEADNFKVERAFFKFSLLYLFVHFLAILAEALLAPYGLGGWS